MTRREAKELLPIIQAFAKGKTIEFRNSDGKWEVANSPTWNSHLSYRIKPEQKYRPFKSKEECWLEMQKHQPFGWIIHKALNDYAIINGIDTHSIKKNITFTTNINGYFTAEFLFEIYKFADGTPFGIKEK